jgi:hypothetical protein
MACGILLGIAGTVGVLFAAVLARNDAPRRQNRFAASRERRATPWIHVSGGSGDGCGGRRRRLKESSLNAAAFSRENGCGGRQPAEFGVLLDRGEIPACLNWNLPPVGVTPSGVRLLISKRFNRIHPRRATGGQKPNES